MIEKLESSLINAHLTGVGHLIAKAPGRSEYEDAVRKINELVDKVNELEDAMLKLCLAVKDIVENENKELIKKLRE